MTLWFLIDASNDTELTRRLNPQTDLDPHYTPPQAHSIDERPPVPT